MKKNNSLILLATYNGEKYIKESLDSFPTEADIFVSDDCSSDATVSIIRQFNGSQITIREGLRHGSAARNFCYMINECCSSYSYYFLADQDDCWTKDKYSILYNEMIELEKKHGLDIPILIYGDSVVVDKNLQTIDGSFFDYDGIDPNMILRNRFNIFFQNIGQGATMIFNRSLLLKVRSVSKDVYMHDWWLMLFAQFFGVLHFSEKKTLLYRQHGNNSIGATNRNMYEQIFSQFKRKGKIKKHLDDITKQIKHFDILYRDATCDKELIAFLAQFCDAESSKNIWKRKYFLFRNKIFLSSFKRTLVLYLYF